MASSTTTTPPLAPYKSAFLNTALSAGILKFGSFTLKSLRTSPYFFNAGTFYRADLLRAISTAYAHLLIENAQSPSPIDFEILFGPAYKGIPLATATVDKLADLQPEKYGQLCYSFDRKEAKDHGEGGNIVGAPLKGKRVLIVDDVVTAGTAKREAIDKIRKEGGIVVGILVALDRMEKLPGPDGDDGKEVVGTPKPLLPSPEFTGLPHQSSSRDLVAMQQSQYAMRNEIQ